ncbi:unnamed protein product [Brassica napus]|nr:unnamed protein product [Brassica napus]
MSVKIPAWRSVVAREVRLQSLTAKGGSFLDNEDVYGLFSHRHQSLFLLLISRSTCLGTGLVLKEFGASSPYGLCGIYPIVGLFSLIFEVVRC